MNNKSIRQIWISLCLIFLFGLSAARYRVSWDGLYYLSSAKSLMTAEVAENYHWIREPFYPFFLKAIHIFFGNADLVLIGAQYALQIITVSIITKLALRKLNLFSPMKLIAIVAFVSLNTLTIGYAGSVLQQSMYSNFIMLISAYFLISQNLEVNNKKSLLLMICLGLAVGSMGVFLFPAFVLTVILSSTITKSRKKLFLKVGRNLLIATLTLAVTFGGWTKYKNYEISKLHSFEISENAWIGNYKPENRYLLMPSRYVNAAKPIFNLGPDVSVNPAYENGVFGMENTDERCGRVSPEPISKFEYAGGYFEPNCRSVYSYMLSTKLFSISSLLVSISMVAGFLIFVVSGLFTLFRRGKDFPKILLGITLPPTIFLGVYVFAGNGNSRYGFPAFASYAVAFLCTLIMGYKKMRTRKLEIS